MMRINPVDTLNPNRGRNLAAIASPPNTDFEELFPNLSNELFAGDYDDQMLTNPDPFLLMSSEDFDDLPSNDPYNFNDLPSNDPYNFDTIETEHEPVLTSHDDSPLSDINLSSGSDPFLALFPSSRKSTPSSGLGGLPSSSISDLDALFPSDQIHMEDAIVEKQPTTGVAHVVHGGSTDETATPVPPVKVLTVAERRNLLAMPSLVRFKVNRETLAHREENEEEKKRLQLEKNTRIARCTFLLVIAIGFCWFCINEKNLQAYLEAEYTYDYQNTNMPSKAWDNFRYCTSAFTLIFCWWMPIPGSIWMPYRALEHSGFYTTGKLRRPVYIPRGMDVDHDLPQIYRLRTFDKDYKKAIQNVIKTKQCDNFQDNWCSTILLIFNGMDDIKQNYRSELLPPIS